MKTEDFIMMPIPASSYTAVCALLGGAAVLAAGAGSGNAAQPPAQPVPSATDAAPSGAGEPSSASSADAGASQAATDGEIDAHGHPWDGELHASTKGKTKDGLWRMKVGVTRPDPLPGFPVASNGTGSDTGTSAETPTPSATSQGATGTDQGQPGTSTGDDDDEFAAFRAAAGASDAADAAAAASAPTARTWADADLGALCNQAAVKLGDPAPVKELIGQYVPAGEVAHSRNIPADKREEFAKAVEAKAGIEFAG